MTWDVYLQFVEGSSSKFWRARVEGTRLFVNFGRIGSDGQTQIKDFDSPERARRELESVAASKRKKGYEEAGAESTADGDEEALTEEAGAEEEEQEEERPARAPSRSRPAARPSAARSRPVETGPAPQIADLALQGERQVDLRLVCVGNMVRTVVVERYGSPAAAGEAFERLRKAMASEGYQVVPQRPDL